VRAYLPGGPAEEKSPRGGPKNLTPGITTRSEVLDVIWLMRLRRSGDPPGRGPVSVDTAGAAPTGGDSTLVRAGTSRASGAGISVPGRSPRPAAGTLRLSENPLSLSVSD